jgi:DNA-binding NarL/FixJ family response regulator
MARILLIDDHPAVRHGLGLVLSTQEHTICGEAGSIAETLELIATGALADPADLALLDLTLGDENGLDVVAPLGERGIHALVYSMHDDAGSIEAALDAGARGYVSKREMVDVLLATIDDVLRGVVRLSPVAAKNRDKNGARTRPSAPDVVLSERENQVLAMLGKGDTNGEIAASFAISVRTLETYFERMCNKLGVEGTRELRRYAINSERREY